MPANPSLTCQVVVARTDAPLATRALVARSFRDRMVGLLAHRALPQGEALVLPRCSSIHTLGMRFPIDAVFVSRDWRVVALRECLGPGRIILPIRDAWGVIELACGTLRQVQDLKVGDQLRLALETAGGRAKNG